MPLKPVPRENCYLIQSAGFFEQMGSALNDFKLVPSLGGQLLDRCIIEIEDLRVLSADNEQSWGDYSA